MTHSLAPSPRPFAERGIRLFLPVFFIVGQLAIAGRYDLPKDGPQFSIQMPENWANEMEGDKVTSRPAKDSRVVISVFPVLGAKSLEGAFGKITRQVSSTYGDVKIGKLSEQKQAGLTFYGGLGEGEKDGFELRLSVAAFSADGKRFYALVWAADEAGEIHTKEIDKALASLQAFKESPPKPGK